MECKTDEQIIGRERPENRKTKVADLRNESRNAKSRVEKFAAKRELIMKCNFKGHERPERNIKDETCRLAIRSHVMQAREIKMTVSLS